MTCRNQPGLDSNPSRWRRDSLIHDARGTSGAPSLCDSSRTAGVNELKLAQVYFLYFSLYLPRKNKTTTTKKKVIGKGIVLYTSGFHLSCVFRKILALILFIVIQQWLPLQQPHSMRLKQSTLLTQHHSQAAIYIRFKGRHIMELSGLTADSGVDSINHCQMTGTDENTCCHNQTLEETSFDKLLRWWIT